MSGIYGVAALSPIIEQEYINLVKWNDGYGDIAAEKYFDKQIFMGIKPERLKDRNIGDESYILNTEGKVGVADSLIFSEVSGEMSDELFLHTQICQKGISAVRDINGDFAGALWNPRDKELILYRDHVGVRPLFYYCDDHRVIFSSDIRGITSIADVDCAIDEQWIFDNVCEIFSQSITNTEYKKIKCVPSGGYISFRFEENSITQKSGVYWVPGEKKIRMKNREAYTRELRKLVEDAVKIRANATNLPIGAELSGGLDSGVIDLLLAGMGKKCFFYSWSPSPEVLPYAEKDERYVINDICEKAGIKCNYGGLKISFKDHPQIRERSPLLFDDAKDALNFQYKYAFPCYVDTIQIYETAAVMQENGVKIVFTGHGGDEGISHRANPYELLHYHEYYRYLRLMYSRSSIIKHRISGTVRLIKENLATAKDKLLKPVEYSEAGYSILNKGFIKQLDPREKRFVFAYDPREQIRSGGIRGRLDVLAFFSAGTGVRYLAPFVDHRVIDFALGIPRYLYHNWYFNRYIFREAFKDIMPASLYKVKEKQDHSYDNLVKPDEGSSAEVDEAELERRKKEMVKGRKELLSWLNRDYWEKYLDYEALEKWTDNIGDPSYDKSVTDAVCKCILAEYMVKRSREVDTKS